MTTNESTRAPMSPSDAGRMGGKATAQRMTPEQRKARATKASIAAAIATIVKRAPELTEDQIAALRSALAPRFEHGETPRLVIPS